MVQEAFFFGLIHDQEGREAAFPYSPKRFTATRTVVRPLDNQGKLGTRAFAPRAHCLVRTQAAPIQANAGQGCDKNV